MLILIGIGKGRLVYGVWGTSDIQLVEGVRKWAKSQISKSVPTKILKQYEIVQIYYMVTKLYFGVREHQFCAMGDNAINVKITGKVVIR